MSASTRSSRTPPGAARATARHATPEDRVGRGKEARAGVPRERHAEFEASSSRPDPIGLLEQQARTRVPELVPIRYARMAVSTFAFYRGAALIMASDLAATPVSGLSAQICGDAHLSNFGLFATPERRMVFDITDFDETARGPWEWDVKRLATSVEVAGRDLGLARRRRRDAVVEAARSYRTAMREFAAGSNLAVWYARIDVEEALPDIREQADPAWVELVVDSHERMRSRAAAPIPAKLVADVDGQPRFVRQPPFVVPLDEVLRGDRRKSVRAALIGLVESYRRSLPSDRRHLIEQYRIADIARKVVGVGSVGTRCWIVLLVGRDGSDRLILQGKEAETSVLERLVRRRPAANGGKRVVDGQRLMQAASDIFLGWDYVFDLDGRRRRDFYLRQFRDWKTSIRIDRLRPSGLTLFARYAGWTLARAHARSGDRIAIAAYLGKSTAFDGAIADFAVRYADQNQRDYDALLQAIGNGRIRASDA
jgi:uncharacterized protein (DUF2252 family)